MPRVHVPRRSEWPDVCVRCGRGNAVARVDVGVRSVLPLPFAVDTLRLPVCRACERTVAWKRTALRSALCLGTIVAVSLVMLRVRPLLVPVVIALLLLMPVAERRFERRTLGAHARRRVGSHGIALDVARDDVARALDTEWRDDVARALDTE